MAGRATVQASDGGHCDLRAGTICLLEDTWGKGHLTTIVGGEEVLMVAVRIPDDDPAAESFQNRSSSRATPLDP